MSGPCPTRNRRRQQTTDEGSQRDVGSRPRTDRAVSRTGRAGGDRTARPGRVVHHVSARPGREDAGLPGVPANELRADRDTAPIASRSGLALAAILLLALAVRLAVAWTQVYVVYLDETFQYF